MNPVTNPIRLILFAVILLGLSPATRAAEDTFAGWAVYLDQDFFIPGKNEDRDYTMGFGVEWFWEAEPKTAGFLDNALSFINDQIGTTNQSSKFQKSLLFGSITFTPEDIGDSNPIFNDRPYASIWYLSSKRIAIKEGDDLDPQSRDTVSGSEFLFGVLGTNLSETFQTEFHRAYRSISDTGEPVDPLGWDNQISNGGEPTLRYRLSFAQSLLKEKHFDLAYTSDISLGYQTNASFGAQVRFGLLDSGFWTMPYDPINRGSFIPAAESSELYVWGAYKARLVGYDALIQGQFRSSNVTFSSSEMERLVHESGIGVTYGHRLFQVSLSASYKSTELKNTDERSHFWGGIVLTCRR